MTLYYARYSANWDNAPGGHTPDTIWNDAANGSGSWGTPGAADTANLNGYNVTLNLDVTVALIISATGTLACSGTRIVNAPITNSGATNGMVTIGTGAALTINGESANSSNGVTISMSGSGSISINNVGGYAIKSTGSGQVIEGSSLSGTYTITGNILVPSTGRGFTYSSSSGAKTVNGNVTVGPGNAIGFQTSGGVVATLNGNLTVSNGVGVVTSGGAAIVNGEIVTSGAGIGVRGTLIWTGDRAIAAGADCYAANSSTSNVYFASNSSRLLLANAGTLVVNKTTGVLYCAEYVIVASAGSAITITQSGVTSSSFAWNATAATITTALGALGTCASSSGGTISILLPSPAAVTIGGNGTITSTNQYTASIVNQSAIAQAAFLNGTAANRVIVTGPALPDAEDVLRPADGGPATYGYAGDLQTGTAEGGYTYGDESAAKVLTTATGAGTFDATNLAVGNVIQGVAFGVGLTGTGANLLATHTTYLSTEASRNSMTAAEGDIVSGHSVTLAGVTTAGTLNMSLYTLTATVVSTIDVAKADILNTRTLFTVTGTFDESARNIDPGEDHVEDGTVYKILNVAKLGTLIVGDYDAGVADGKATIIAALVLPATDLVDAPTMYGVNLAGYEAYYLEGTGLNQATLTAALSAAGLTLPTGTYACIWTVNDGTTALQGAKVSFWLNSVLKGNGTTGVAGTVPMSLDAATYTVAITLDGYRFASTTHVVSATASTWTKTFSMSFVLWPASTDPDTTTVRWRVRKASRAYAGSAECTVYMGIASGPGVAGVIYNGDNLDFDSDATDASGYVYFANTPKGSTVAVKTATDGQVQFVQIPRDCGDTFEGLELIGSG